MANFSFDIVSTYDKAEMNNAVALVQKELASRYDFRGTPAALDWLGDKKGVVITGASAWQIGVIVDLFVMKLAARSLTSSVLDMSRSMQESAARASRELPFKEGLSQDDAKRITRLLKDERPKLKASIQGDSVRVSGSSKDELQAAMRLVEQQGYDFPVRFINFR